MTQCLPVLVVYSTSRLLWPVLIPDFRTEVVLVPADFNEVTVVSPDGEDVINEGTGRVLTSEWQPVQATHPNTDLVPPPQHSTTTAQTGPLRRWTLALATATVH